MTATPASRRLSLRVLLAPDAMLGPGKAELLERVRDTGSISAAGRAMGMSYKRAWDLASAMNKMFDAPLIQASKGGSSGGGAVLTPLGTQVLATYRRIEQTCAQAAAADLDWLRAHAAAT
ncbi:molybdate transport system regulatory protein [Pseudoxanthomonas sp. GM95]|uniref:winged helix-turn-helix domain-containing protein n=1 Tax=Pseudoxanthomonas sp. GM95 TaxID=1881043 RepID=UPI0008C5A01E|nr:LysR family transcriptional regulator [Pseudoxanthomonas sp. GM95]SEL71195.1 molybdate transport system regulatory protein [Pseudoxanthomonas sp. GM95]